MLSQLQDGVERPIAFASRTLSKSERNYCVTHHELLAIVEFVKQHRQISLFKLIMPPCALSLMPRIQKDSSRVGLNS